MISYLSTLTHIYDSLGHFILFSESPSDILDWLVFSCSATHCTSTLRAFWDVDAAVTHILSLLPNSVRESLSKTDRAVWGGYRLFYAPGKLFSVNKDHNEVTFYSLDQYFPDTDCQTTSQVASRAQELLTTLSQLGIPDPTKLTSPVAVWESSNQSQLRDIPTIYSIPDAYWEAFEYALQCTPREWTTAYQLGTWADGELFDYDLASAYGFAASRLMDLRDCQFTKSDRILDSAYCGFVFGDLYINPSHPLAWCSPILSNLDGKLTPAVGRLPADYYTLDQIRFIERYGMGSFKLQSGWFISPYSSVRTHYPFRDLMRTLYSDRDISPLASYFLKRVMNGIIGRMLQSFKKGGVLDRYSDFYNPVYHALITSAVKVRVAEFIIEQGIQQSELVHIGVDGFKSTKRLSLSAKADMGQWVCKGSEPTIILSPGRIYTPTRPKGGATYHLLRAITEAYPNRRRYEFNGTAVDLNVLQLDQTRHFSKMPKSGGELTERYYSEAIVL